MDTICFYRTNDAYGAFSNFADYPIRLDGRTWKTSEHYFQAQKFSTAADQDAIAAAATPMLAARLGRERTRPLREDWEGVKDQVMYRALEAKFAQHEALRTLLLGTGSAVLVEHTSNDAYWGDGGDGSGRNRLGELLMQLRAQLREAGLEA